MENEAIDSLKEKLELLVSLDQVELNDDQSKLYGIDNADLEEVQDG